MGCISSKFLSSAVDLDHDIFFSDTGVGDLVTGDCPNHFVSLTSTTYGVLNLDRAADYKSAAKEEQPSPPLPLQELNRECKRSPTPIVIPPSSKKKTSPSCAATAKDEPSEVINAWELMGDLSDETPIRSPLKKPSRAHQLLLHFSPAAAARATASAPPKKPRNNRSVEKENTTPRRKQDSKKSDPEAGRVLRPYSSLDNSQWAALTPAASIPKKKLAAALSTGGAKRIERDTCSSVGSRRSLSPLFDLDFIDSLEKAHCEEGEQIKKMVSFVVPRVRRSPDPAQILQQFEKKCPPGGENVVILYTTTLRGIRRTYEDCNTVRSAIDAYDVQIVERDISMDSGYREELRLLMGKKEVKVPMVFVKGRLIGGVEQVVKLNEEGKLGLMLEGIPSAERWCEGCGGVRFVMCADCNGSCKVLDEEQKKMVKCGQCNENGLIHCPICC